MASDPPPAQPPLPAVVPAPEEETLPIPKGSSVIHQRPDASQVWRLCCRLRLEMRDGRMNLPEVHRALTLTYSDLKIGKAELKTFMEDYVDGSVLVEPGFFLKGLMRSKARLNAVVEAGNLAELMQTTLEKNKPGKKGGPSLSEFMAAAERTQRARERQHHLQQEVGFGVQREEERAKSTQLPTSPINIEHAEINFGDSVGGSFAKRARAAVPIDAQPKPPAASSA